MTDLEKFTQMFKSVGCHFELIEDYSLESLVMVFKEGSGAKVSGTYGMRTEITFNNDGSFRHIGACQ